MPHMFPAGFGLASILALAACTPSGIDMTDAASVSNPAPSGHGKSAYRQNPHPKQAYRITMTIADAPGAFASMTALAQYDVTNRECLLPPKDNPGGHTSPVPTEDVEMLLTRVSDTEYVGTVYADRMLDEDYNGRGVCHWKLIQFRVHMKATGTDGETLFIPSIPDEKLQAEKPETIYFNKRSYPTIGTDEFVNPGLNDRSRFGPSIRDEDLFTVTFTPSKEATR